MSFLYKLLKKNKESFPELTLKNEDNFKFEEEKKQITEKELIENVFKLSKPHIVTKE